MGSSTVNVVIKPAHRHGHKTSAELASAASVVVGSSCYSVPVSRTTFPMMTPTQRHTDSQGENNTSHTVAAGNNVVMTTLYSWVNMLTGGADGVIPSQDDFSLLLSSNSLSLSPDISGPAVAVIATEEVNLIKLVTNI